MWQDVSGSRPSLSRLGTITSLVIVTVLAGCCCNTTKENQQILWEIEASDVPRELDMATIPAYRVAPPDILLIEAVNNIRPAKDPLRAGDELIIRASNTL